jgi:hypothetical protein
MFPAIAFFALLSSTNVPVSSAVIERPSAVRVADKADVEILTGTEATGHLQALQTRRHASFEKAAALLRKRGFVPTDHAFVMRPRHHVRDTTRRALPPFELAEFSSETSDGEFDVWSWDDGDPGTWEGTIYAENYHNGSWVQFNAQIDISTGAESIWDEVVGGYDAADDSGPVDRASLKARQATAILASLEHSVPTQSGIHAVRWDAQTFYGCALKGCLAAAVGCIFSGPAWPECFFVGCTTAISYCILDQLF